ncbi:sulfite exporter TauE/SafE family protein [Acinetobacter vivianii]|uniref:sulfite exporter TauE/SafE family protein n=1 Tax=Acinetobacter vivianii TaxID=1776742 RepID=UPI002DB56393|nr:sulfite exporter TauE/SafE family protein [Acinetobacter vivianii]MEB6479987.1 sulfite exporter TauE/SafE family protein [Acinetobacter vivianii]MEB6658252.1 sulfite exporter TauE/SafE family protein [Acinetobacter vivianii]
MDKTDLFTLLICVLAAVLHGLSGFGFPMISTAALSLVYPLSTAVAMVIIPCILMNLSMLKTAQQNSFIKTLKDYLTRYWLLIGASLIGSLIGVNLLIKVPEGYLKIMLGIVMLLYVIDQFRHKPLQISASLQNMLLFGLLAGIVGGATNAMAPFLMMYLLSTRHQKNEIVIISNLSFLASKLVQLLLLYPSLLNFNQAQIWLLVIVTIVSLIFVYLGAKIRNRLSQQKFKYIIFIILTVLGFNALWQGFQLL